MTIEQIEYYKVFSEIYFNKIFGFKTRYKKLEPHDFFYTALTKTSNVDDYKKVIIREIYKEYYSFLGEILGKHIDTQKKCKKCGEVKHSSHFNLSYDRRHNFYYLRYQCRECQSKYHSSDDYKEKRRLRMAKPENAQKNRDRVKKYYYELRKINK